MRKISATSSKYIVHSTLLALHLKQMEKQTKMKELTFAHCGEWNRNTRATTIMERRILAYTISHVSYRLLVLCIISAGFRYNHNKSNNSISDKYLPCLFAECSLINCSSFVVFRSRCFFFHDTTSAGEPQYQSQWKILHANGPAVILSDY